MTVDDDRVPSAANSLNALRLALAMIVVISHVPKVRGASAYTIGDLEIGGWAVAGFFAISGWLVTQSRLRLPFSQFVWRRSLRILPGFWACLMVTAMLAAPLAAIAGHGRWRLTAALRYVAVNLALRINEPKMPGSLRGLPDTSTWNLSLWTLSYEFACYLGIGVFMCLALVRRSPRATVAAFVIVAGVHAALVYGGTARDTTVQLGFRLASFFLAGAVLLLCPRIRLTAYGALAALSILVVAAASHQARVFAALPVAYLCLWLGRVLPLRKLGRRNDLSYGVYVYAFPLQQLLMCTAAASWRVVPFATLSMAAVLPVAYLSWRFVEQPALRLKNLGKRGLAGPGGERRRARSPVPHDL